jgi:hypothetical protein
MPILYIHGVNTRSRDGFFEIEPLLRRLVAPALATDAGDVPIDDYFWGDLGIRLAWGGLSRPRTRLLGQGAEDSQIDLVTRTISADENRASIAKLPASASTHLPSGGLVSSGGGRSSASRPLPHLRNLSATELSDLLCVIIADVFEERAEREPTARQQLARDKAIVLLAADAAAHDERTHVMLANESPEQQLQIVLARVHQEADRRHETSLAAMGFGDFWSGVRDRMGEALDRSDDRLAYFASVLVAEKRPKLTDLVGNFLGDVFIYLKDRDNPASTPGKILNGLIAALEKCQIAKSERQGEPLVVLTHSMGGQLIWDAVTWLLPKQQSTKDVRIDFWCAMASQVGFFEEAKLFAASDSVHGPGKPVPFPSAHLGTWWNVWDPNDFLSFTAKDICAGVDDGSYDSGSSLIAAHGGYFKRPSFYRQLAKKIAATKARGFNAA